MHVPITRHSILLHAASFTFSVADSEVSRKPRYVSRADTERDNRICKRCLQWRRMKFYIYLYERREWQPLRSLPPFFSAVIIMIKLTNPLRVSCDGRVVKALDLKSNGVSPRRFEPCSQRYFLYFSICCGEYHTNIQFTENYLQ